MKVLVLGGDGFCGWPTALHLSAAGHEVAILDNLFRRYTEECPSLTPIASIEQRLAAWKEVTGKDITFLDLSVQDEDMLRSLLKIMRPDAIIHFAEQRSAPFSMRDAKHKSFTVTNNIEATHSLLNAMVETGVDSHLIHLGTMGVYGYGVVPGAVLPEGYLPVEIAGHKIEILHPTFPGSIYHMTKVMDQTMFAFYAKNDGLRITDLHQGIVWGTQTKQTSRDIRLINRFDYDGHYGTVLNRFIMQAAIGYPLTVHGTGGQTRAFIHISDTVRCIELALQDAPARGDRVRIINQMTEVQRIRDLAMMVGTLTGTPINYQDNPRKELAENDLEASNGTLIGLGLKPVTLNEGLMSEVLDIAKRYAGNADRSLIDCTSRWVK